MCVNCGAQSCVHPSISKYWYCCSGRTSCGYSHLTSDTSASYSGTDLVFLQTLVSIATLSMGTSWMQDLRRKADRRCCYVTRCVRALAVYMSTSHGCCRCCPACAEYIYRTHHGPPYTTFGTQQCRSSLNMFSIPIEPHRSEGLRVGMGELQTNR